MSQTKAQLLDNIKDNVQLDARNSLRFADTDSSHYVAFKAPATVSSNVTWTLPAADGSANYVLATDGSGTLSWIADPAGQWTTSGSNLYFTGGNVGIGDSSPSNPLSVTGASSFNGDVTFTGANYNVLWDKSTDDLIFADNAKAAFGTSSDLTLFHDGSHSEIDNNTGNLSLKTQGNFQFFVNDSEDGLYIKQNGAVELYHDNSKKFETTSYGNASAGQVRVTNSNATTVGFSCGDAGTGFYNSGSNAIGYSANGTQKWNISSIGDLRLVDNVKANFGTGDDLQIYHDGSNSYISNTHASSFYIQSNGNLLLEHTTGENYIKGNANGSVELYYDGSKKFETYNGGCQMGGDLSFSDSQVANFGTGSDLQIYHDGSDSYIVDTNAASDLFINSKKDLTLKIGDGAGGNHTALYADNNGAVRLYHDNTKRFETTSTGSKVTGADLTVIGTEGISVGLYLIADEGDDNGDGWRLNSNQDANDLTFANNTSGSYVDKLTLENDGDLFTTGHLYIKNDSKKLILGASDDLQIYHDGNNSYIEDSGTGSLILKTGRVSFNDTGNNEMGRFDGEGLKFNGDSAAANALDDYEEGTFTPAMSNAYSNITYFSQNGLYVKIGRMVHCTIAVAMTAATAEGPQIRITNLPFTSHANNYSSGGITYCDFNSTFVDTDPYISGNTSEVRFYKKATGSAVTGDSTNITSEKYLGIGITYQV